MNSRFLTIIFPFLLPGILSAQTRAFDCGAGKDFSKEKGSETVTRVQSEYAKVSSLRAKFYQDSYLAALETSELSSGVVSFVKPGKMKWEYAEPEKQEFTIRDNTLWLYQIADNQVVIDDFSQVVISDLPVSFLMGIGNLKEDFLLTSSCQNSDGIVLELAPKKKGEESSGKGELQALRLLVSPASFLPIGAKVIDVAGNVTAIILKEIEKSPSLSDSLFETIFPKGTDVSDRRTMKEE